MVMKDIRKKKRTLKPKQFVSRERREPLVMRYPIRWDEEIISDGKR